MQPFYCLTCKREEMSNDGKAPEGWLSLIQITSAPKPKRLGMYCSLDCLDRRMPRIGFEIGEALTREPAHA